MCSESKESELFAKIIICQVEDSGSEPPTAKLLRIYGFGWAMIRTANLIIESLFGSLTLCLLRKENLRRCVANRLPGTVSSGITDLAFCSPTDTVLTARRVTIRILIA